MLKQCTKTTMYLVLTACLAACGGAEQGSSGSILFQNDNTTDTIDTPTSNEDTRTPEPVQTDPDRDTPSSVTPVPSGNVPNIGAIKLKSVVSANAFTDISEILNGESVNLTSIEQSSINILAEIDGDAMPGSVHFQLSGPVTIDRVENQYEYTMANSVENISLDDISSLVGDYMLQVTPYELADMGGEAGATKTVAFSFSNDSTGDSALTRVLSADLYAITDETEEWVRIGSLRDDGVIDLGSLPSDAFNIAANMSGLGIEAGSVDFTLEGPTSVSRTENEAPFTLQDDTINFSGSQMETGEYTLRITPYELANAGGQTGSVFELSFRVVREAQNSTPVTSVEEVLAASDDYYTVSQGSSLDSRNTSGAGRNDTYDSGLAVFSIESNASHGDVFMTADGHFTYSPEENYVGRDTFSYTLSQGEEVSTATVTITVSSTATNSGFTPVVASNDTRIIYVSSSSGSDNNDCLSPTSPCSSIPAGLNKARNGYPDHVLLARGNKWTNQCFISPPSGRSPSEPFVLGYYGDTGARPEIRCADKFFAASTQMRNVNIQGITFNAYKLEETDSEFSGDADDIANIVLLGNNHDVLFEDVLFNHVEVILQGYNGGNPKNVTLRRNIWTGAYYPGSSSSRAKRPSNLFAHSVDGLIIEENVFDSGGWNENVENTGSNQYNHNMYIQFNNKGNTIVVRNNIVTRASSHGVHGRPGGLYEDNFFARNAISLQMGYRDYPLASDTFAHAFNNVVTEGWHMIRGDSPCSGANLCTNAVWGIHVADISNANSVVLRGNLVAGIHDDDQWQDNYTRLKRVGISSDGGDSNVEYSNNTVWAWDEDEQGSEAGYSNPGRTLADYNESLGGSNSFDGFMDIVLNRALGTWDSSYTAKSINDFIRDGYSE